jgi:cytidylate kinase
MTDKLIMLSGPIGSGKSTVANILTVKYGFKELLFAAPLKKIALAMGFTYNSVYGTQYDKIAIHPYYGISAREFLQKFGTEICRAHMPSVLPSMCKPTPWIACMDLELRLHSSVVISDGRFLDEAEFVNKRGGKIIKIVRDNNTSNIGTTETKAHASETDMAQIKPDHILINDGTLEQLETKVHDLVIKMYPDITKSWTYKFGVIKYFFMNRTDKFNTVKNFITNCITYCMTNMSRDEYTLFAIVCICGIHSMLKP